MEKSTHDQHGAQSPVPKQVQELGYRRLEIIAGVQSIEHLRKIAGLRKMQTYEAFEGRQAAGAVAQRRRCRKRAPMLKDVKVY
ncbi:MAG: hypothetical protein IPP36_07620 [Nitrosomonadales bacterium]|nr:hypothetical protein [Nitrosomonadales bacterium]